MTKEIDLEQFEGYKEAPLEEPDRQYYYMAKCRRHVAALAEQLGRTPTCCVTTFGCQMNTEHEIEKAA